MIKKEIIDYINKGVIITMPAVQKKFSLSYFQTKELFYKLVEEGRLFFASGITYNVRSEGTRISQPTERPRGRYSLSEYMKARVWTRETKEENNEEDTDEMPICDKDDEEDDRESFVEDEEENVSDNDTDNSIKMMRVRVENLSKLFSIKKIFNDCVNNRFHCESVNQELGNVISLNGGLQLKLDYNGGVLKIIYDGLAPRDCTSVTRAETIINEYKSLSYESGQIVATVKNNADALDALLELHAAVERINRG